MTERLKEKIRDFKSLSVKERIIFFAPYIISSIVCSRIVELYRLCHGNFMRMISNMEYLYKSFPHFIISDLIYGIPAGILIAWYLKWEMTHNKKNMRKGVEYGSARWGTYKDIQPFIDPNPFYNIILSKTERLTMSPKMKKFNLNRNKNVIVYGSSGSGKTFSFVKPNLLQCNSSYVITDPKRVTLLRTYNVINCKMR